jgi:hypothetical protein
MKKLIGILALLAAGKIGVQEYLYRSATSDIIVAAYRQRAIVACQDSASRAAPLIPATAWTAPAAIVLSIGKASSPAYIWQIHDPEWQVRFRNPYLIVTPSGNDNRIECEYDIVQNSTYIRPL